MKEWVIDFRQAHTVKSRRIIIYSFGRLSPMLFAAGWLLGVMCPAFDAHAASFTNTTPINVMTAAGLTEPYPSTIDVISATGRIANVSVTLHNVRHVFPDDLDVLLVGSNGRRVLLMSDAGGSNGLTGVDLTFSQSGKVPLPDSGQIVGGTYKPTDYEPGDVLPAPAPSPPYSTNLTAFNGADPNGQWQLFADDDSPLHGGGAIAGGWSLDIEFALPPTITSEPANQTVAPGDSATFKVWVKGTPPFVYEWLRNGRVLVPFGEGADSLTITNVQATNAGIYSVVVANSAAPSGVASSGAVLNVLGPLALVEPPSDEMVEPGDTATLRVVAAGTPPLYYQWQLNGFLLDGETNSTLTVSNAQPAGGGGFTVTVLNDTGAFTTGPATLVVRAATDPPPTDNFSDRPRLQDTDGIVQGDSGSATNELDEPVFVGGGKTVWLEWTAPADGIATFSAKGSAFDTMLGVFTGNMFNTLNLVTRDDDRGGFYTSEVQFNALEGTHYQIMLDGFDYAGTGGQFTMSWSLNKNQKTVPVILYPPAPVVVMEGSNATFQVFTGPPSVSYQWLFQGNEIPGATEDTYTVTNAVPADVGFYSVRLTGTSGLSLESPPADLQIGGTAGGLLVDKFQSLPHPVANGNRPTDGFISIGLGVTDSLLARVTNSGSLLTPCNNPISSKYRYRGLTATNDGVIFVTTAGSDVLTRLAVYPNPLSQNTNALDCDTNSAPASLPATLHFNAINGEDYIVVVETYQATGNIELTSAMGIAPPLTNTPLHCFVAQGGSFLLTLPATNWIPSPDCQWRLNGQDIPGGTNATLLLTNFSMMQTGAYSVVVSNFIRVATNTVADLALAGPLVLGHAIAAYYGTPAFVITASNYPPFILVTSTNLASGSSWVPLITNENCGDIFRFTNANSLEDPRRFFRAIPWPAGP